MPFEPLQTDEKLTSKAKPERDMDSQMIFGCSSFVFVSIMSYILAVWPMFVVQDTHTLVNLGVALAAGLLPASIFGGVATRKTGLPGACGFVGGAMAMAIFLFLRLEQLMLGYSRNDIPQPEYPRSWVWLVPLIWLVAAILVALVLLPKREFLDESETTPSR
ncbi:MAG: hypothetical protein K1X67_09630 [Fimbriimonadaceae bacterium]|nr:hypothetical protein [Fimbriimonadaceae bacterium]